MTADADDVQSALSALHDSLDGYEEIYKHLHRNPELSNCEEQTSAYLASALRKHGVFEIHEKIGGHGLAAVWKKDEGKTILLRADMDALPVEEATGLPYSSERPGVMHACGHDIHMTCMLAATAHLVKMQDRWRGTLIILFQPAEEKGTGAQAMVDGGLYDRIPIPDLVAGQHVMPKRAGTIGWTPGVIMGACDSFRVTLYGSGGHGSAPHTTVDPIVMACNLVTRLQTIVSRELSPQDIAVVTVGSIHAGLAENVISDSAELGVDIRSVSEKTRQHLISSIRRMIDAEYRASRATKEPTITQTRTFPATDNDEATATQLEAAFRAHFGDRFQPSIPLVLMAEDVSIIATSQNKPCLFWHLGGIDHQKYDAAEKASTLNSDIPGNHSSRFQPVIRPTLDTGVDALCLAVLTFLAP